MAQIETVEIEGAQCEVTQERICTVCEKSPMAIRRRARSGGVETQYLECPRCCASATRQVDTVAGVTIIDSDTAHKGLFKQQR